MATQVLTQIEVVRTISGNSPFTLDLPEAAGQTFVRGAILTLGVNGFIIEATSPNPQRILGVAAEDAHNYATTDVINNTIHVWIADDDTIFKANLTTGQASDNFTTGKAFGLIKVGAGLAAVWTLDGTLTSATHANFRAIGIVNDPRHALGDTQAWVHFMFNQGITIMLYTS